MFFHIDESGNTGLNLFDENQRRLSYGVLSSRLNVDVLGASLHRKMTRHLGINALHANEMGMYGIDQIADELYALQKKFHFGFDYHFIDKPAHALVVLFDAVFDAGINRAVKWDLYWTQLRFPAILNLARIVDEAVLKEAWALCTAKNAEAVSDRIVELLNELKVRLMDSELDARTKELFSDAFEFGIRNPLKLDFGVPDTKLVSPNAVGFQFVVRSIARRSRKARRKGRASITIDLQQQFNKSQMRTHELLTWAAEGMRKAGAGDRRAIFFHPLLRDVDPKELQLTGMPIETPEVSSSKNSIGLQLVDLYLWMTNRLLRGEELPVRVMEVARLFLKDALVDNISLEGISERWQEFDGKLTAFDDLSEEELDMWQANVDQHRKKVAGLWAGK